LYHLRRRDPAELAAARAALPETPRFAQPLNLAVALALEVAGAVAVEVVVAVALAVDSPKREAYFLNFLTTELSPRSRSKSVPSRSRGRSPLLRERPACSAFSNSFLLPWTSRSA
jgi:hypothetical protein